jgi:hypothetical protein
MRCREFRERIVEGVRSGGFEEDRGLLDHLQRCRQCSESIRQERELEEALGLLRQDLRRESPPAHAEERLLGSFRASRTKPPAPSADRFRSGVPGWIRAAPKRRLAAMAAGVLLISLLVREVSEYRQGSSEMRLSPGSVGELTSEVKEQAAAIPESAAAEANSATASIEPAPASPVSEEQAAPPRRRGRTPGRKTGSQIAAIPGISGQQDRDRSEEEAFLPTMFLVETDGPFELQLIRVELPRRAMRSFGLAVDSRDLDRPVKADLLVGPDGLTRGIRFVSDRK